MKNKKCLFIIIPLIISLIICFIFVYLIPQIKYSNALDKLDSGELSEAKEILANLNGFSDSEEQLQVIEGKGLLGKGDFESAIDVLHNINANVNVKYNFNGGNAEKETENIQNKYNNKYIDNDCFRDGYKFLGWKIESYEVNSRNKKYSATINLIACWDVVDYKINLDYNGSIEIENPSSYTIKEEVSINNPSRKGYQFIGWSGTDLSELTIKLVLPVGTFGDKSYTANWKPNNYTLTFDLQGGVLDYNSMNVEYDKSFTLPIPEKVGYQFVGWKYKGEDFTSEVWNYDDNITIVAVWNAINYNIIYDLNGGINDKDNPITYNIESEIQIKQPTKVGHVFLGWQSNIFNDLELYPVIERKTTNDIIFTAVWEPSKYVITFDLQGGFLENSSMIVEYNKSFILPTPEKTGYLFAGWSYEGNQLINGVYQFDHGIVLVANWNLDAFVVSYNLDGGKNDDRNVRKYQITDDDIQIYEPSKEGYTFIGWTSSESDTKVMDYVIKKGTSGNLVLTAHWEPNEYYFIYSVNNNPDSEQKIKVVFGEDFDVPNPLLRGYEFVGWYYNDIEFTSGIWNYPNDIIVTAVWNILNYNIKYSLNGGINNESNPATYNVESELNIQQPTKVGYEFLGWEVNSSEELILDLVIGKGMINDLSLVAKWNANEYVLSFNSNGGDTTHEDQIVVYDSEYSLPIPSKVGYSFEGWYINSDLIKDGVWNIASNCCLIAKWKPNDNTKYIVRHYEQNIEDDEYTLIKEDILYGTSDSEVIIETLNLSGFTSPTNESIIIKADGTTIHNYYYTRNYYQISFVTNGGESISSVNLKFGTNYQGNYVTTRTDSTFGGWFKDKDLTTLDSGIVGASNQILYAWWMEETKTYEFLYNTIDSGIEVTKFIGSSTNVVIPKYINNNCVIVIKGNTFETAKNISELLIPNTVKTIENSALYGCSSLFKLTIPHVGINYSETINSNEPSNPDNLFGVIFGQQNFENSVSIQQWYMPSYAVNNSSMRGWSYCIPANLSEVIVTGGIIAPCAFSSCSSITKISLIDECIGTGRLSFYRCYGLKELYFGPNVERIEQMSFGGLPLIEKITLPFIGTSHNSLTHFGLLFDTLTYTNNSDIKYDRQIRSINPYSSTVYLVPSSLDEIILSDSCTKISSNCFENFEGSFELFVGKNITEIGDYAFRNCLIEKIKIDIEAEIDTIGTEAFNNCSKLVSVDLPCKVNKISSYAFKNCVMLETVILGPQINGIYWEAFENCTSLSSVYFRGTIEHWCKISFETASANPMFEAENFYLLNNENEWYEVKNLEIPNSITNIGKYQFVGFDEIENICFSNLLSSIEYRAFMNCSSLLNISLPNTVAYIGPEAFKNCTSLTSFVSSSIIEYGNLVFSGCESMELLESANINLFSMFGTDQRDKYLKIGDRLVYVTVPLIPSSLKTVKVMEDSSNLNLNGGYEIENLYLPKSIKAYAASTFYACINVKNIYYNGTIEEWNNVDFSQNNSNPLNTSNQLPNLYVKNVDGEYYLYE